MAGKTEGLILEKLARQRLHFSLLDPDPKKLNTEDIVELVSMLEKFGTSAFLVGGSSGIRKDILDARVCAIKDNTSLPVILFPGNAEDGISKYADAILFMSLMNSRTPLWITGMQASGAFVVRETGLEAIPLGYIIVEPGMKAGKIGKAAIIKQKDRRKAASYALAAQYLGMRFVYLEAGSGAAKPVPPEMVMEVSSAVDIPVIVGGGLRTPEAVRERLVAGASIIVTGTVIEKTHAKQRTGSIQRSDTAEKLRRIISEINKFKK